MSDWGIKVVKSGKSITSVDIRDHILHSNYSMFKIHETKSDSITINAGGTTGTVTLSHNLGYVPAFLVYEDGHLFPQGIKCYATTTGITINKTLSSPYDRTTTEYTASHFFSEYSTGSYYYIAGDKDGNGWGSGIRFANVAIGQGQTIDVAQLDINHATTTTGDDIHLKMYGIDEDNTDPFGDPMSRTKTTAYNSKTVVGGQSDFNYGDTITTICQEIVDRAGWESGNAMGFIFNDDNSPDNKAIAKEIEDSSIFLADLVLKITLTGSGSLTTNYKVIIFKDKIV